VNHLLRAWCWDGRARIGILLCLVLTGLPHASTASFLDQFKDPKDGQFDTSDWLIEKRGFLPVPIIITEPAIGYGGGVALLFFHGKKSEEPPEVDTPLGLPPSVSAVFGAGTENGTWIAGGGHFGSWREDHIRYTGGAGYASMNLTFFRDRFSFDMNLKGFLILQQFEFRLWESNIFVGPRYQYSKVDATREGGRLGFLPDGIESALGGLGLVTHYDSRDNIFTPNSGQDVTVTGDFYDPAVGSDTTWQKLGYKVHSYHPIRERTVVGLRFDGNMSWGNTPFYALPYVQLRGIPALRYQGRGAGEGEVEARVRVWKRWSVVGFFGLGWTFESSSNDNGPYPAGGGGIRYLLARKLGMQVGVDVARGPEDTAFYIQVGSAW
jgi:hypothetical protein